MKKLLFTAALMLFFAKVGFGQSQSQTYYDAEKTKLKEVYMMKTIVTMDPTDPKNSGQKTVKYGPYFYYYENGKLKVSGQYTDDKKSGEWKYYDENGKLLRTENYVDGALKNP